MAKAELEALLGGLEGVMKARIPPPDAWMDLLGPLKKPARKRAKRAKAPGTKEYKPLRISVPQPKGITELELAHGAQLGVTCLICKDPLKSNRGRPPKICDKKTCFRAYRNAYRLDYDFHRPDHRNSGDGDGKVLADVRPARKS